MLFRADGQGLDINYVIQGKTITQTGDKFRAEISFSKPEETPKTTAIITSDGNRVIIYRPDLQQYTVVSKTKFDQLVLFSLSSLLFLVASEDDRLALAQGRLEVLKKIGLLDNGQIKGARSTTPEENLYIYEYGYTEPKITVTGRIFVAPESATLKQIQFKFKEKNVDYEITEKILRRTPNPNITSQTFKFKPPKTAKPVKTLSIFPF